MHNELSLFGEVKPLRIVRLLQGKTQAVLARESEVNIGLISAYELGHRRPHRKHREKLARALGLDVEQIDWTTTANPSNGWGTAAWARESGGER